MPVGPQSPRAATARRALVTAAFSAAAIFFAACSDSAGSSDVSSTSAPAEAAERAAVVTDHTAAPTSAAEPGTTVPPVRGDFLETFDGAPDHPTPFSSANWDITVHSRDDPLGQLEPMEAGHGVDCGAPPLSHTIESTQESVFQCKDHVMTALGAEGYGLLYLTPNRLVDFSEGTATISLDVSTKVTSRRDWWDIWIVPYEDHLQLEAEDWYPDLNGAPFRGVHIKMETFNSTETGFIGSVLINHRGVEIPGDTYNAYEKLLTPDAARRDTFELQISTTHVKFGMPDYGHWWMDTDIPDLGWDQGVVQIGHHSYNPNKDDVVPDAHANTWHWDNIAISPSIPFTMIPADVRIVEDSQPITFASPAPEGAMLRFAGIGEDIEYSTDGGKTWTPAELQRHELPPRPNTAISYWTPIPAGTQQIQLRGNTEGEGWGARDISIWAAPPEQ